MCRPLRRKQGSIVHRAVPYHCDPLGSPGTGRLAEALAIAKRCLAKAARENRLAADWRTVAASDAVFDRYDDMLPRFYLFTLKGYAYLQMRLGNLEEGRAAVLKLLELDPSDKVGARVLLGVLERTGRDDE